jgi:hypothetical protein
MKILNRVGGTFLLLVLAIAATIGFQSPAGRPIWNDLWQAGTIVVRYLRDLIQRLTGTSIPGHASVAVAIAAVGVVVLLALLKKPISVRTFTLLVLLAGVGAVILYDPTIVA